MFSGFVKGVGTLFHKKNNHTATGDSPYKDLVVYKVDKTIIKALGEWYINLCLLAPNKHKHKEFAQELYDYNYELKENESNRVYVEYLINKFQQLLESKGYLDGQGEFVARFKQLFNQIFQLNENDASKVYAGSPEFISLKLHKYNSDAFDTKYETALARLAAKKAMEVSKPTVKPR